MKNEKYNYYAIQIYRNMTGNVHKNYNTFYRLHKLLYINGVNE